MKLALRFDMKKFKKLRFQNVIQNLFHKSFRNCFLEYDDSIRATAIIFQENCKFALCDFF